MNGGGHVMSITRCSHCKTYSLFGFFLGVGAPLGWLFFRLVMFHDPPIAFFAAAGDIVQGC
jgi:hypothetical protein